MNAQTPEDTEEKRKCVRDVVTRELPDCAGLFEEHGENLQTAVAGEPVFVEHLQRPQDSYYLVPLFSGFQQPGVEPYFVAQVAADNLKLLSIDCIEALPPDHEAWIYAVLNEDALEERLKQTLHEYVPKSWASTGRLAWKFCRQSFSPLKPFHVVTQGDSEAYVDIQGNLHTELDLPRPVMPREIQEGNQTRG